MTHSTTAPALDPTTLGAAELARLIAAGRLSSRDVVEAHIRRIEAVNGRLNALVVPCFDRARAGAAAADAQQARGEPLGPLHGVPVTIKECFHVAGTPATLGIARFRNELATNDSPLVDCWQRAGAIVLGKTNVPQLMLLHETDNPVYGRTNNPWNFERGAGGSSGGEAALIAAGGSPLGLASDLGGSIRQPAHACGVAGLLPTEGRLELAGVRDNFAGLESLSLQPGPIARRVEDLHLGLRVLVEGRSPGSASHLPPVGLGDPAAIDIARLRIGLITDDGFFLASPALRRVVEQAGRALAQRGAHVEPFALADAGAMFQLYLRLLSADGGAELRRLLGASRADWRIRRLLLIGRLPRLPRTLLAGAARLAGQQRLGQLIGWSGAVSADCYRQLTHARRICARRFVAALDALRLDALVLPPHALPALRHGSTIDLPAAASYSLLANLVGLPAGVVPAGRVAVGEESDRAASRDLGERAAREAERASAGLPVGVQVIARHWREDLVLAVMRALEQHFSGQADYPQRPPL